MNILVLLYLVVPVIVCILAVMTRETEIPDNLNEKGLSRTLIKIAFFLCRKLRGHGRERNHKKVMGYLSVLDKSSKAEESLEVYYAHKISVAMMLLLAGSVLSILIHFSSVNETFLGESGVITRNEPGNGEQSFEVIAKSKDGNKLGEYDLFVGEQLYTEDAANELFEEASEKIEEIILLDNLSLNEVSTDLNLVKNIEGFPFTISWQTDNYDICDSAGHIKTEALSEKGSVITLTATYKYNGNKWEQIIYVNVVPQKLTESEKIKNKIRKLLTEKENETRYEKDFLLPTEFEGKELLWEEKIQDNSFIFMLLTVIMAVICFVLMDEDLARKMEIRRNQMLEDYPQLLSQVVLYLGAGMTVRNVFLRLSDNYLKRIKNGAEKRYVYEELVRTTREITAGKSEIKAYEDFGHRCMGQEYIRFSTLLSQNLRKGNSELFNQLEEESNKAFEERLAAVRKKGEEAGTKLLMPMILMLIIVMVVIMIPAYMTF